MLILSGLLGFFLGIGFMLFFFSDEIYHGQKVGYGKKDVHPNRGCCSVHLPPPGFLPPNPPPKKQSKEVSD